MKTKKNPWDQYITQKKKNKKNYEAQFSKQSILKDDF